MFVVVVMMGVILPITNNKIHYNSAKSWLIELVRLVPETVQDSKQDTIYVAMFDLVCKSEFGNFAESCGWTCS